MNIVTRRVKRKFKIGKLFEEIGIKTEEHAMCIPNYKIRVKTPYGYKKILSLFRTEKQETIRTYFTNGTTLKTSQKHRLKSNGEWRFVEDLQIGDIVETENSITKVKRKKRGKEEILFDISVDEVQCYYSNGILSHNSWFLSAIGANALKQGKKVIHYTLELSSAYTGLRYDAVLSGINFQNLKYHKDEVKETIDKYKDSLLIKQYPATIASVSTVMAHIKRAEILNFKPDLIIIDYADLLTTRVSRAMENSYHIAGRLYEELRGLSVQIEAPIWTASQSNRSAAEEEIIEGHNIADSFKKIMTADFIMSVSRKTEDKIAGTGRVHIIKNRFGPDGITFNAKINASNGNIGIFDNGSIESNTEQKKQNNRNEYLRKMLSQKHKELDGV